MNWLGNPCMDRADFELWALAVSAINGSGACNAHEKTLRQVGASLEYNSNGVRFAAIVQSVAVAIETAGHGRRKRPSSPPFCTFHPSSPGMATWKPISAS